MIADKLGFKSIGFKEGICVVEVEVPVTLAKAFCPSYLRCLG